MDSCPLIYLVVLVLNGLVFPIIVKYIDKKL